MQGLPCIKANRILKDEVLWRGLGQSPNTDARQKNVQTTRYGERLGRGLEGGGGVLESR